MKIIHHLACMVVVLAACTLCSQPQEEYQYMDYPSSLLDKEACGRAHGGEDTGRPIYVCDPNNLLKESDAVTLDVTIESVMNETDCQCSQHICGETKESPGYRIGVILLKKLQLPQPDKSEKTTASMMKMTMSEASNFASRKLAEWDIGRCNDDVVILYSIYDGVIYTVTGDVSGRLLLPYTIAEISQIRRTDLQRDVYNGLLLIISDYKSVFLGKYKPQPRKQAAPKFEAVRGEATTTLISTALLIIMTYITGHV